MSAKIIDGKLVAQKIKENLKAETEEIKKSGKVPGLAVVIVGDDAASRVYVNSKKRACEEVGFHSEEFTLAANTSQKQLLGLINTLNHRVDIHGILVQLPLPKQINEEVVLNSIHPLKDVDGFHPVNVGKLMIGKPDFVPCTPGGVMELIKATGISIAGKECVVVGRSNIVGKPQAMLLLAESGTVTMCHSKTKDLAEVCKRADILVAAVGKAKMITSDMVKKGAVVIDVGINRQEDRKLCGDVDFEGVAQIASHITPVPGGVGPMTIAMLMKNTLKAFSIQNNIY